MIALALSSCDRAFSVQCGDRRTADLIASAFGGLLTAPPAASVCRRYRIDRRDGDSAYRFAHESRAVDLPTDDALLYVLDKDLTIALQVARRDLFFLHAGVVWTGTGALAFPAQSGTGKSTLTMALLAHGFQYMSDELAPVDVGRATVSPYAHAVYFKHAPPAPYSLPSEVCRHGRRFHVPVRALPQPAHDRPAPLGAIVFPERRGDTSGTLRPISPATAAARLLANALNPLAHSDEGLDAAVRLSQAVPAFEIDTSNLPAAVAAIREAW